MRLLAPFAEVAHDLHSRRSDVYACGRWFDPYSTEAPRTVRDCRGCVRALRRLRLELAESAADAGLLP